MKPAIVPLLFCLLEAVALVRAVRSSVGEEAVGLGDSLKKGNEEDPETHDGDAQEDIVPDAVSRPCEKLGSSSFAHVELGAYSAQELMDARCDERLLVLLQKELLQISHYEIAEETTKFTKQFPLDWATSTKNKVIVTSVATGALTVLTGGAAHIVDAADSLFLDGLSVVEYIEFLHHDLTDPEQFLEKLVKNGASASTLMWQDIPLGTLEDVRRSISMSYMALTCTWGIVLEPAKLHSEPKGEAASLEDIEPGTMFIPEPSVSPVDGWVLVSSGTTGTRGWVEESKTLPSAWLQYKGKHPVDVCGQMMAKGTKCPKEHVIGHINPGESFKVAGNGVDHWVLAGNLGVIPKSTPGLDGPLGKAEALQRRSDLQAALSLDGKAVKDGTILNGFNDAWSSKASTHAQMAVGVGLLVGGIITHGLLFLIAGIAWGVSSQATNAVLAQTMTVQQLSQVSYMELALLAFERQLFEFGSSSHDPCDIRWEQRPLCKAGYTCLREGAFVVREDTMTGFCVRSPWEELVKAGAPCSVDSQCASGSCEHRVNEGRVAKQMTGTCGA